MCAPDLPDVSNVVVEIALPTTSALLCMGLFSIFWSGQDRSPVSPGAGHGRLAGPKLVGGTARLRGMAAHVGPMDLDAATFARFVNG